MRTRIERDSNYKAVHVEGMTLRVALDPHKPIAELRYPEFYDIKITDHCEGKCTYCYQDSRPSARPADWAASKIRDIFEPMTINQRPFQIAYGGGEPTTHPEFPMILRTTRELGISPNYTTNGMHVTTRLVKLTRELCDGVAVSLHPHLAVYWARALRKFSDAGVKTNVHVIISDEDSVYRLEWLLSQAGDMIHKVILLPYTVQGRAREENLTFDLLFKTLKGRPDLDKIGFGALFYPHLLEHKWLGISLYEPESMSKYIDLCRMTVHPSSFMIEQSEPLADWLGARV